MYLVFTGFSAYRLCADVNIRLFLAAATYSVVVGAFMVPRWFFFFPSMQRCHV